MKARWKIWIALAGCVLVTAGVCLTAHIQAAKEVEAYKQFLRGRGEKLDLTEVLPPPAAPAENSAHAFQAAVGLFRPAMDDYSVMRMVAPGKAETGWQQPDFHGYDFTNSWTEYRARIAVDWPAVELLHQVLDRPKLDFGLDYKIGSATPMTPLVSMKRAAQKLVEVAMLDLHDGDAGGAATNVLTMLALVQRDHRDNLLIGHLVRIAIVSIAVAPTWELLQATNLTDGQLAAVQSGWQELDFLKDMERTMATERVWVDGEIQQDRASHQEFKALAGSAAAMSATISGGGGSGGGWDWKFLIDAPRYAVAEVMWRSSWSYGEELQLLKTHQIALETLRAMQTNRSEFYKADYDVMMTNLSVLGATNGNGANLGGAFFQALDIPDFQEEFGVNGIIGPSVLRKNLQVETARRVVVAATALKRFELKHAKLPATLAELTPEFLASLPIDPYDGKPLKYHPNDDGTFVLYSVGDDGIDNGGDVTPAKASLTPYASWQRGRDWVWPQPATPAEVQHFHEHPPQ